jgi:hypothetical protein
MIFMKSFLNKHFKFVLLLLAALMVATAITSVSGAATLAAPDDVVVTSVNTNPVRGESVQFDVLVNYSPTPSIPIPAAFAAPQTALSVPSS